MSHYFPQANFDVLTCSNYFFHIGFQIETGYDNLTDT